jgi:hypothetical protein
VDCWARLLAARQSFPQLKVWRGVCFRVAIKRTFRRDGKTGVFLLLGFLPGVPAIALVVGAPGSPYNGIVERNAFLLQAPTPTVVVDATPKLVLPKVMLTGITTILGRKVAFITIVRNQPGQLPESLILAEGQVWGEIRVKEIDETAGRVKISNHHEEQTLDFVHDEMKPVSNQSLPIAQPPVAISSHERPLTPEGRVLLMEAQRMNYRQQNDPTAKILPPTELTPEIMQ